MMMMMMMAMTNDDDDESLESRLPLCCCCEGGSVKIVELGGVLGSILVWDCNILEALCSLS